MHAQAFNGSMVYWYNSTSYRDDLTWAAAWLYKATGDSGYLSDAYYYWTQHVDQEGIYDLRYLVRPPSGDSRYIYLSCTSLNKPLKGSNQLIAIKYSMTLSTMWLYKPWKRVSIHKIGWDPSHAISFQCHSAPLRAKAAPFIAKYKAPLPSTRRLQSSGMR